jgi:hypothetical protein
VVIVRYRILSFKLLLVFCIGFTGGCDDNNNSSNQTRNQFSYSVLTSDSGRGLDLLEELTTSVLPKLTKKGAQEYAIWSWAPASKEEFEEIAEENLVLMLRWKKIKNTLLADELESMTGVSNVATSFWEVSLRGGEGPIETGPGFYIHRFNRYLNEDVDEVLSLSEQSWETWEPFWEAKVVGVWSELNEVDQSNGITRLMRIAWYRDMEHWQDTREFWREPESFKLFIERAALQLDDESLSAHLETN